MTKPNEDMEKAKRVRFVVNSGAGDHMINNEDHLEDVKELTEPVTEHVLCLNCMMFYSFLNLKKTFFRLERLVSMGKWLLLPINKEVIFEYEGEVGTGKFADGLFYLDCIWDGKSGENASAENPSRRMESGGISRVTFGDIPAENLRKNEILVGFPERIPAVITGIQIAIPRRILEHISEGIIAEFPGRTGTKIISINYHYQSYLWIVSTDTISRGTDRNTINFFKLMDRR